MGFSLEIYFDHQFTATIKNLVQHLNWKINGVNFPWDYSPHLTIGYFKSELKNKNEISDEINHILPRLANMTINFSNIGLFPDQKNKKNIIFLGAVCSNELFELNKMASVLLKNYQLDEYYKPSQWIPHLSLCFSVDNSDIGTAVETINNYIKLPIKAYAHALVVDQSKELFIAKEINPNDRRNLHIEH
jgi:2'-5' RNA ligase